MEILTTFIRIIGSIDRENIDSQLDIPRVEVGASSGEDNSVIAAGLEIAFGVAGAIALIIIIIAGMQFVLSRGDSQKAAKARNAIIYAAVGLAISLVAFSIVRFAVRSV